MSTIKSWKVEELKKKKNVESNDFVLKFVECNETYPGGQAAIIIATN